MSGFSAQESLDFGAAAPEQDPALGNERKRTGLFGEFIVPPFSTLDTRQGYWQERRRAWLSLGIRSEVGRDGELLGSGFTALGNTATDTVVCLRCSKENAKTRQWCEQCEASLADAKAAIYKKDGMAATSIFDPVVCELAYRWYCPPGGSILDPFAGGSVRGIVAGGTGYEYHGVELRAEQIASNLDQAEAIFGEHGPTLLRATGRTPAQPSWHHGDATDANSYPEGQFDFAFSCPPYGDLEVYSDNPADLSTMEHRQFTAAHALAIREACERLRPNSFAAWVVGDFRDKKTGALRGFVNDTVDAFRMAGLAYYNEHILINAVGTAQVRARRQFNAARKTVKLHQNMLVFVKGDAKAATRKIVPNEEAA